MAYTQQIFNNTVNNINNEQHQIAMQLILLNYHLFSKSAKCVTDRILLNNK